MSEIETEVLEPQIDEPVEPIVETPKPSKSARTKPVIKDSDDAILELRRENEKLRKTLDEASAKKAEKIAEERIETAKAEAVANAQKLLDDRMKEVEERTRARVVKSELKAAASRAGVIDFEDAFQIMQRDLKSIEFDDDGNVTNATDLVTKYKEAKPYLFGGVSTSSIALAPASREQKNEKSALEMSNAEYRLARSRLAQL